MKPTYRRSWAGNLLMFSDLTLGSPSRSNDSSLALVSCLFGGYKFALVLRCVGLVTFEAKWVAQVFVFLETIPVTPEYIWCNEPL